MWMSCEDVKPYLDGEPPSNHQIRGSLDAINVRSCKAGEWALAGRGDTIRPRGPILHSRVRLTCSGAWVAPIGGSIIPQRH